MIKFEIFITYKGAKLTTKHSAQIIKLNMKSISYKTRRFRFVELV